MNILHFKDKDSFVGDSLPYYENGNYHFYYLKASKDNILSFGHVLSKNLINWEVLPDYITRGDENSLDRYLLTGCVIKKDDTFHAFYGGGNNGVSNILKATSKDGINFEKQNRSLFKRNKYYGKDDTLRDPDVFFNPSDNLYHMIFCAKVPFIENDIYPGCIGHATSKDLENWTLKKPLWEGRVSTTIECPQIIKVDDSYAFIYYWHDTKIRISNKILGPFVRKAISSPNHFDFMAAKALYDGNQTIMFGWIPRKDCDCKQRTWGGTLAIPRILYLDNKKNPCCRFIDEIYTLFKPYTPSKLIPLKTNYIETNNGFIVNEPNKGGLVYYNEMVDNYYLHTNIEISKSNSEIIFFIRTDKDLSRNNEACNTDTGYLIDLDFGEQRLMVREHYKWDQRPDLASIPLHNKKTIEFEMVVNEDILEICIDKKECLSFRMLEHNSGSLAISIQDTKATFTNYEIRKI